jgi:hypothetical protein
MPTRIWREGIIDSHAVNSLSLRGEVFYRRLMSPILDGSMRFRSCFAPSFLPSNSSGGPKRIIAAALDECASARMDNGEPLVLLYSVGSKKHLQINKFNQRTRAQQSKFPPPAPNSTSHLNARQCRTPDGGARAI